MAEFEICAKFETLGARVVGGFGTGLVKKKKKWALQVV